MIEATNEPFDIRITHFTYESIAHSGGLEPQGPIVQGHSVLGLLIAD